MPVLVVIATLVIVLVGWRDKDGFPPSELYRQKFLKDC